MTTSHVMPFGAEARDGGVCFRLWAPALETVDVVLHDASPPRVVAMERFGDGWFRAYLEDAGAGTPYGFRIDGGVEVPDPASRYQPEDVHGPSVVVDPTARAWEYPDWTGRPWHEAVIYELHVGTFSPEGTFAGVERRLDHLADLGVTAVELMPIADFSGRRNWGYDGVLPFAPDSSYGTPEDLKRLVDAAHGRGLMMFLDVVYNHFGPDGNFLHAYAPQFFTDRFETPWGAAIDFSRREVRDFFIHNALYWLEEFRFDGLRLDAVHAIVDESEPDILEELAETVRGHFDSAREVHLVLENEHNAAHRLDRDGAGRPRHYVAQWNDDIHHAFHVLATGESAAYYADFAERPLDHLVRCLAEGFAFQGEAFSPREGGGRGEPSGHLPAGAFISFIQNHDQVGNRAFGDRLTSLTSPEVLKALTAVMLLAPSPPMLFMGEEWGATEPFLFFCDFRDDLANGVREGRRREFARFPEFRDPEARERIPDPNAEDTFAASKLDWDAAHSPDHESWLDHCRELLGLRHRYITPRLSGLRGNDAKVLRFGAGGIHGVWRLGGGSELTLVANLAVSETEPPAGAAGGRPIFSIPGDATIDGTALPPWSVIWSLRESREMRR